MPKGPQGQKRPADAIGAAIRVARIATGEESEDQPEVEKKTLPRGSEGGKRRAEAVPAERRTEIAKKAALSRWQKEKHPQE